MEKETRRSGRTDARYLVEKAREAAAVQGAASYEALFAGLAGIFDELQKLRADVDILNSRQSVLLRALHDDPDFWRNADPVSGQPRVFQSRPAKKT